MGKDKTIEIEIERDFFKLLYEGSITIEFINEFLEKIDINKVLKVSGYSPMTLLFGIVNSDIITFNKKLSLIIHCLKKGASLTLEFTTTGFLKKSDNYIFSEIPNISALRKLIDMFSTEKILILFKEISTIEESILPIDLMKITNDYDPDIKDTKSSFFLFLIQIKFSKKIECLTELLNILYKSPHFKVSLSEKRPKIKNIREYDFDYDIFIILSQTSLDRPDKLITYLVEKEKSNFDFIFSLIEYLKDLAIAISTELKKLNKKNINNLNRLKQKIFISLCLQQLLNENKEHFFLEPKQQSIVEAALFLLEKKYSMDSTDLDLDRYEIMLFYLLQFEMYTGEIDEKKLKRLLTEKNITLNQFLNSPLSKLKNNHNFLTIAALIHENDELVKQLIKLGAEVSKKSIRYYYALSRDKIHSIITKDPKSDILSKHEKIFLCYIKNINDNKTFGILLITLFSTWSRLEINGNTKIINFIKSDILTLLENKPDIFTSKNISFPIEPNSYAEGESFINLITTPQTDEPENPKFKKNSSTLFKIIHESVKEKSKTSKEFEKILNSLENNVSPRNYNLLKYLCENNGSFYYETNQEEPCEATLKIPLPIGLRSSNNVIFMIAYPVLFFPYDKFNEFKILLEMHKKFFLKYYRNEPLIKLIHNGNENSEESEINNLNALKEFFNTFTWLKLAIITKINFLTLLLKKIDFTPQELNEALLFIQALSNSEKAKNLQKEETIKEMRKKIEEKLNSLTPNSSPLINNVSSQSVIDLTHFTFLKNLINQNKTKSQKNQTESKVNRKNTQPPSDLFKISYFGGMIKPENLISIENTQPGQNYFLIKLDHDHLLQLGIPKEVIDTIYNKRPKLVGPVGQTGFINLNENSLDFIDNQSKQPTSFGSVFKYKIIGVLDRVFVISFSDGRCLFLVPIGMLASNERGHNNPNITLEKFRKNKFPFSFEEMCKRLVPHTEAHTESINVIKK